jgi:hypothetical protein
MNQVFNVNLINKFKKNNEEDFSHHNFIIFYLASPLN